MAEFESTQTVLRRYMVCDVIEAGCDEAGRGCLAGPVFAAAVILSSDFDISGLDDSKRLSSKMREQLRIRIESSAAAWCVATASVQEILKYNILNASILAMHRALDGLQLRPQHILVDGNRFSEYGTIPFTTVVGGDGRYASIAAASILAKTHRDEYMCHLAEEFPMYGWDVNKGYPTAAHRRAIIEHGACEHHRSSFKGVK